MKLIYGLIFLVPILTYAQPCELGYELNGSNDYVKIPNTNYINTNNTALANRTIETWFKADNATNRQVLFEEGGGGNAIVLYLEGNRVYSGAYKSNGNSSCFFRSEVLNDDEWYHVAYVIETIGGTTSFLWYLNGVLQDSQTAFTIPKHTGDNNLGRNAKLRYPNCVSWSASSVSSSGSENCINSVTNASNTKYYFDGNIWGFRIWNVARTDIEINTDLNNELFSGTGLVAYLDDDSVEYLDNSSTWMTANGNGNTIFYTWHPMAVSNNFSDVANWSGGLAPNTNKLQKVIIPESSNYPIISSEVRIGKLELSDPTSEIIIEDGGTLNVYYDFENNGNIKVNNNGAFILQDNEAVSGTGNFIIERDSPNYPERYYFSIWSTPLLEGDSRFGDTFTNNVSIFKYDSSQDPSAYVGVSKTDNMQVGGAYFVRSKDVSGITTRVFNGKVNNGCFNKTVYYKNTADAFNLLGNPYPSAIDWLSFYEDNSDVISGTMHFWSQSYVGLTNLTSDYISYNALGSNVAGVTGNISTASGVFVEALKNGTIMFKNTHRLISNNNQFFRSSNKKGTQQNEKQDKIWIMLSGEEGFQSILLGFKDDATLGYDSAYDGKYISYGSSIEFYSLNDNGWFAIQGLPMLETDIQIPLGYRSNTIGNYTIAIDEEFIASDFEIFLEDKQEGILTNLRAKDYVFESVDANYNNERFILYFTSQSLSTDSINQDNETTILSYFEKGNLITVLKNIKDKPKTIEAFDVLGKSVFKGDFKEQIPLSKSISGGVYLINYLFEDNKKLTKKILKIN